MHESQGESNDEQQQHERHRQQIDQDGLDRAMEAFTTVRPRLFGIAYRMLGSVSEAEDILQDTWLRWPCSRKSC